MPLGHCIIVIESTLTTRPTNNIPVLQLQALPFRRRVRSRRSRSKTHAQVTTRSATRARTS